MTLLTLCIAKFICNMGNAQLGKATISRSQSLYLWLSLKSPRYKDEVSPPQLSLSIKQYNSSELKRWFWWEGHILMKTKRGLYNSVEDLTKVCIIILRKNLVYKWMLKPMHSGYANVIQLSHPMNYPLSVRLWRPWYWNNESWKSMLCERTKGNYKSYTINVYLQYNVEDLGSHKKVIKIKVHHICAWIEWHWEGNIFEKQN